MKPVRTFAQQVHTGAAAEAKLDRWAEQRFGEPPEQVDMAMQKAGIDRTVAGITLEYKADSQGHRTGNVFLETISVDRTGKPGWVWTTEADWVVYWLPASGDGWLLAPAALRDRIWDWSRRFRVKVSSNPTYHSYGLLVPVGELEQVAAEAFNWKDDA